MRLLILLISVTLAQAVVGADWKKLDGIYAVTAEGYIDPAENEETDSHFRIQLREQSAKSLYSAMKVEPVSDECTGGMAKNIDDMQCLYFEETRSYECHFSINISQQKIEYGVVC